MKAMDSIHHLSNPVWPGRLASYQSLSRSISSKLPSSSGRAIGLECARDE